MSEVIEIRYDLNEGTSIFSQSAHELDDVSYAALICVSNAWIKRNHEKRFQRFMDSIMVTKTRSIPDGGTIMLRSALTTQCDKLFTAPSLSLWEMFIQEPKVEAEPFLLTMEKSIPNESGIRKKFVSLQQCYGIITKGVFNER